MNLQLQKKKWRLEFKPVVTETKRLFWTNKMHSCLIRQNSTCNLLNIIICTGAALLNTIPVAICVFVAFFNEHFYPLEYFTV